MNKKILLFFLGIFLVALTGCNFQFPEKVSVKTNAAYSFCVGNLSYPLNSEDSSTEISLYKMLSQSLSGSDTESSAFKNMTILDYNPDSSNSDACQQIAIKIPIQQLDIDFSQYLDKVNLDSYLTEMKIDKEIEVPSFDNIQHTEKIDISEVSEKINSVFNIIAQGGIEEKSYNVIIAGENDFDSIIYSSGYFDVQVYDLSASLLLGSGSISLDDIENLNKNTSVNGTISIDGTEVAITNGKGSYQLINKSITKKDGFIIGTSGISTGYCIRGTIREGSKLDKVVGLTLSPELTPTFNVDPVTFNTGNDSALKECDIGEGNVTAQLVFPSSWSNVTNDTKIEITEGLTKNGNSIVFTKENPSVDLENVVYKNGNITVETTISLAFDNSTITFTEDPEFDFSFYIKKLNSVKIAFDSDVKLEQSVSEELPEEALNILKSVEWNEVGLNVVYSNTLPEGNDIKLKVSSDFLGIDECEEKIVSGKIDEELFIGSKVAHTTLIGTDSSNNEFKAIDLKAAIELPNYVDGELTLNDVELGKNYQISFTANAIVDWNAVTINNDAASVSGSQALDLNMTDSLKDMDSGIKNILQNVQLESLPVHVYCDVGDLTSKFDDPSFTGIIKACSGTFEETVVDGNTVKEFKPDDTVEATYLLGQKDGDTETDGVMNLEAAPDFEKNEDGTYKTVTTEITGGIEADLKDLVKNILTDSNGLNVDYNVKFSTGGSGSEIRLVKNEIMNLGKSSIDLSAIIILPMKLKVTKDTDSGNILTMFGIGSSSDENWDLFNRTSEEDLATVKQYADLIKSVELIVKNLETPLIYSSEDSTLTPTLKIDIDGSGKEEIEVKNISLTSGGDVCISLPVKKILDVYPLQPEVSIIIPEGTLGVKREIKVSGAISLKVQADGSKQLTLWDKNAVSESSN